MPKVVIIMGKSSSGKDTIYKELLKRTNLQVIVPYTTRPMRTGEVNGKDYYFVTDAYLDANKDKIIESRTYKTEHGDWTYGELMDHQMERHDVDYILVTTLEGYKGFSKSFDKKNIIPIYVFTDNGLRLQRALDRERSQQFPKYTELCRRFLSDEQDFSDDKLLEAGIVNQFENDVLEDVINAIIEKLKSEGVKL